MGGIDIVAIRDDPIAGMEKLVIALHRKGLASSRDVNVFADLVSRYKADKGGILISTRALPRTPGCSSRRSTGER